MTRRVFHYSQLRVREALFGWKIEKGSKTARRMGPLGRTWFRMVVYFWLNLNLNRSAKHYFENKISKNLESSRLCCSSVLSPAISFHLCLTGKTYLDRLKKSHKKKNCFFVFDFLCCIEVFKVKWLNSECLNSSVKSKHQLFKGSLRRLTLAFSKNLAFSERIVVSLYTLFSANKMPS